MGHPPPADRIVTTEGYAPSPASSSPSSSSSSSGVVTAHSIGDAIAVGIRVRDGGANFTVEGRLERADVAAFAELFVAWLLEHPDEEGG